MARILMLDEHNPYVDPDAVAFLQDAGAQMGQTLNIMRGMANHPKLGAAFFDFAMSFYGGAGQLTPKECELAYMTATVVNECFY